MAGALTVLAVLTVRGRFDDPDMWWHLKTGQVIWKTHHIPLADIFSYTARNHAWIPQEWLSQVLIYSAYKLSGYSGLMLWLCAFSATLMIAGYILCSQYSGNAKVGFLGAILIWFFSTIGLAVRPQVVGYLFLIVELLLLSLGQKQNTRWFYGLPLLLLLWVNCHASFFFGLIVLGVFVGCSLVQIEVGPLVAERWSIAQRKALGFATVLSAVAVFLNPVGWRLVMYPVNTLLRQPLNLDSVSEWQPLPIGDPREIAMIAILLFIGLYVGLKRPARIYLHEVVLVGMGAWLGLNHQRMVFVFSILAAPVVTRLLAKAWEGYDAEKDKPAANAVLIAMAAVIVVLAFPSQKSLMEQVEQGSPVKAVEYIQAHHLTGNMINAYNYGGYLIWALPEHPVFIDGRADVYEWAGVLSKFGQWATLKDDPNRLLNQYDVSFCLLQRGTEIADKMAAQPNWKRVFADRRSVIFVRKATASRDSS